MGQTLLKSLYSFVKLMENKFTLQGGTQQLHLLNLQNDQ